MLRNDSRNPLASAVGRFKAHCGDKSLQQRTNPSKIAGSTRKAIGSVAPKGIL